MSSYIVSEGDLEIIADNIRNKTRTSSDIIYPSGFVSAINGIASDCLVTSSQMMYGKTAFSNTGKITGSLLHKSGETFNADSDDITVNGPQYLDGDLIIRGITTSNIAAANIKEGVVVKVGDTGSAIRIKNVTGTCIPATLPSNSFCPFMWARNNGKIPAFYSSQASSGTAAETTAGYRVRCYAGGDTTTTNHPFRLPCDMTITYFANSTSTSSATKNLTGGTTYKITQYDSSNYDRVSLRDSSDTHLCYIWKIVSWTVT